MTFDAGKLLSFDLETWGAEPGFSLQPSRLKDNKSWITSLAYVSAPNGDDWDIRGGLAPSTEDLRAMLEYARDNDLTIVGWNLPFDVAWLIAAGLSDLVFQCNWLDAMKLKRHVLNDERYGQANKIEYGLKETVREIFPAYAGYEDGVDFGATDDESLDKLHRYNIDDTILTLRLARHFLKKLSPAQLRVALIEASCIPLVAQMNVEGLEYDQGASTALQNKLTDEIDATLAELAAHGATETIIASSKQLGDLLFDSWGLPALKHTDKGARSCDGDVLHELSLRDDRVALIMKVRESKNLRTKYAINLENSHAYNYDGRLRPEAKFFATYTGRFAYTGYCEALDWTNPRKKSKTQYPVGFAVHQMPRGAEFRAQIVAPEGCTIVEYDATNQEFRIMALMTGDATMLRLCQPGEDAHSYMGAAIGGVSYDDMRRRVKAGDKEAKSLRALGKLANLSLQYETSPETLLARARTDYGLDMKIEEAHDIHATYHATYPGVARYWARQKEIAQKAGFIENAAGRRIYLTGVWDDFGVARAMGATSINFPIQSLGAEMKYLALKYLRPYLAEIGGRLLIDMHDGLIMILPDAALDDALPAIKAMLDDLPYATEWGYTPSVPLPWDCKIGKNWGALKEFEFDETHAPAPEPEPAAPIISDAPLVADDAIQTPRAPLPANNQEFLEALVGEAWRDVPVSSGADAWGVLPAGRALAKMSPDDANYFCVSTFDRLPSGKFVRQKRVFRRQWVLFVDDIGTKLDEFIAMGLLPVPTYKLETSPGNYQWVFKIAGGCADRRALAAVVDAIVNNAALNPSGNDPGMKGVTRVCRLAFGANHKAAVIAANGGKPFASVMSSWSPELSYTIEELAESVGADISEEALARNYSREDIVSGGDVSAEDIASDNILRLFESRGMIRDPQINDNGFIVVECPWAADHTDSRDEAGYRPGKAGFQCHHGHCESKTMADVVAWADGALTPEEKRAVVVAQFENAPPIDGEILDAIEADALESAGHSAYVYIETGDCYGRLVDGAILTAGAFNKVSGITDAGRSGLRAASNRFVNEGGRVVNNVGFVPGAPQLTTIATEGAIASVFNTWRPGMIQRGRVDMSVIQIWLNHVEMILPDPEARTLFLDWCAFLIQRPGDKINWCYVLQGSQGTGKDALLRPVMEIIGSWNCRSIQYQVLEKDFNEFLLAQVIVIEELPSFRKQSVYDNLKSMVAPAQSTLRVNLKYRPAAYTPNIQCWFAFTNHEDALQLEQDDRRFFIYGSPAVVQGAEYFDRLFAAYKDRDFLESLHGYLAERDISKFRHAATPPMTEAKRRMLELSRPEGELAIEEALSEGDLSCRKILTIAEILAEVRKSGSYQAQRSLSHKGAAAIMKRLGWEPYNKDGVRAHTAQGHEKLRLWVRKETAGLYAQMSEAQIAETFQTDKAAAVSIKFRSFD